MHENKYKGRISGAPHPSGQVLEEEKRGRSQSSQASGRGVYKSCSAQKRITTRYPSSSLNVRGEAAKAVPPERGRVLGIPKMRSSLGRRILIPTRAGRFNIRGASGFYISATTSQRQMNKHENRLQREPLRTVQNTG